MNLKIIKASLKVIRDKCEQYWNERNIGDAEIHAALEYIERCAWDIERRIES